MDARTGPRRGARRRRRRRLRRATRWPSAADSSRPPGRRSRRRRRGRSTDGLLGRWDVRALADGPYVLRLDVTGRSGARVQEFAPLSLERVRPSPVSSEGPPALAPDVSGSVVVYESERPDDAIGDTGVDVFAADLLSGRELGAHARAGHAAEPAHLGAPRRVSRPRKRGRRRDRRPACSTRVLALRRPRRRDSVRRTRSAPVVSGARIFWIERDANDGESPRLCDLRHGARSCSVRARRRPSRAPDRARGLRLEAGLARAAARRLRGELRARPEDGGVSGSRRERGRRLPVQSGRIGPALRLGAVRLLVRLRHRQPRQRVPPRSRQRTLPGHLRGSADVRVARTGRVR